MQPRTEALTAGSIIAGRYQISSLLGQGGMSRVYLATDLRLNLRVALKENLQSDPQARDQFQREARILARLSHPSLPRVMDHLDDSVTGKQYLVMDYVEGEDLNVMVKRVGHLPETTAVNWTQQILSAVEYLHGQQPPVIHRDIKPSNIKITPSGKAVLVDFGIAKTYEASGMTVTGARAATPGYAPPEQYGLRTDQRSDIYALGATLYTLLTGQVPPESTLRISNLSAVIPPRQIVPDISPQVEMAMLYAMDVDTHRRWQSASEFRSALMAPSAPPARAAAGPTTPAPSRPQVGPPTPVPSRPQVGPPTPTPSRPQVGPATPRPALDRAARTPIPQAWPASSAAPVEQIARPVSLPQQVAQKPRRSGVLLWGAVGILVVLGVCVGALLVMGAFTPKTTIIIVPGPSAVPVQSPTKTPVPSGLNAGPALGLVSLQALNSKGEAQPPRDKCNAAQRGNRTQPLVIGCSKKV